MMMEEMEGFEGKFVLLSYCKRVEVIIVDFTEIVIDKSTP